MIVRQQTSVSVAVSRDQQHLASEALMMQTLAVPSEALASSSLRRLYSIPLLESKELGVPRRGFARGLA